MLDLEKYIRVVPDFPKKGISYKDISPLLMHPEAVEFCVDEFVKNLPTMQIDKVVGVESRGFFFAMLLAQKLKAGFVPVRKKGKLPYKVLQEAYDLEYGNDWLEIHQDAILPNENVLVHDDVLATGGTARAACNLVKRLEGEIVQCNFLLEIKALNGIEQIKQYPTQVLLSY
ncbi:adenine phosphoribosyltransferase [Haloflavibacter putidus]|uniref:Adenine phosphoribosyltransferase n=1 Tax=Haloflavibacter putidus TaxID=2576776 RepID=A0A507ZPG9_9FLAO|nr:adenine phosphoribosyltransferase [Haloflavibacter putidus]TQD38907.1 adenine phosphoribosyltransferase [Haloflavibacter putidus]